MFLEISALIASIAFLILVAFVVPTVVQLRRTARELNKTTETLNMRLPSILTRVDDITADAAMTSRGVRRNVQTISQEVDYAADLIHETVDLGYDLKRSLQYPLLESIMTFTAAFKGASAFMSELRSRE